MRKLLIGLGFVVIVLGIGAAAYLHSVGIFATSPVYTTARGAIDGYDPVAFFSHGEALRGSDAFRFDWRGSPWYFSGEENREQFSANPERFAPRYGGYCAYAMANGYTAHTDPTAWTILDGRLYLNFDTTVQEEWRASREAFVAQADANWPASRPARALDAP